MQEASLSPPRYTKNLYCASEPASTGNLVAVRELAAARGFRVIERQPPEPDSAARDRLLADARASVALRLVALDFMELREVELLLLRLGA